MRTITNTSNLMPEYIYMPLSNEAADVFIYKFISEDEDGYIYETNEFRTARLKKEDIASDPLSFLDYEERKPAIEERIAELEAERDIMSERNEFIEECLIELANIIYS